MACDLYLDCWTFLCACLVLDRNLVICNQKKKKEIWWLGTLKILFWKSFMLPLIENGSWIYGLNSMNVQAEATIQSHGLITYMHWFSWHSIACLLHNVFLFDFIDFLILPQSLAQKRDIASAIWFLSHFINLDQPPWEWIFFIQSSCSLTSSEEGCRTGSCQRFWATQSSWGSFKSKLLCHSSWRKNSSINVKGTRARFFIIKILFSHRRLKMKYYQYQKKGIELFKIFKMQQKIMRKNSQKGDIVD